MNGVDTAIPQTPISDPALPVSSKPSTFLQSRNSFSKITNDTLHLTTVSYHDITQKKTEGRCSLSLRFGHPYVLNLEGGGLEVVYGRNFGNLVRTQFSVAQDADLDSYDHYSFVEAR